MYSMLGYTQEGRVMPKEWLTTAIGGPHDQAHPVRPVWSVHHVRQLAAHSGRERARSPAWRRLSQADCRADRSRDGRARQVRSGQGVRRAPRTSRTDGPWQGVQHPGHRLRQGGDRRLVPPSSRAPQPKRPSTQNIVYWALIVSIYLVITGFYLQFRIFWLPPLS